MPFIAPRLSVKDKKKNDIVAEVFNCHLYNGFSAHKVQKTELLKIDILAPIFIYQILILRIF